MTITNLTNTTWVLNNTLDYYQSSAADYDINISFTSNNTTYDRFCLVQDDGIYRIELRYAAGSSRTVVATIDTGVSEGYWESEAYRTIHITGGSDVTNATFIAWLKQNAIIHLSVDVASLPNYSQVTAGQHTISIIATSSEYRNSLPTNPIAYNKLAVVTSESVNEDTYTFNSVTGAASYDIYVDDGAGHVYLLGTLSPSQS